ncbi:MAG: helix-turn-helix domain-containing protein [Myxococcales bacterium]|nr:helix-turn-helix domain-containing protein [Myxococcales bacterium]MDH3482724.1 helix-turn-helix domain-containing protein [Myxococcales bacterium]
MTVSVTLLTEREHVAQQWGQALANNGIQTRVVAPSELANALDGQTAVVVDIDDALLPDELLSTLGYVRAVGAIPIAHVEPDRGSLEDIVSELCDGLVTTNKEDVTRVAAALTRRSDPRRHLRFEFVTVSPCGDDILAVLGNGDAALHRRPIDPADDGSEITNISIDPNATTATLQLKSGVICRLGVGAVHSARGLTNGEADIAIDGEKLGARLRELRLAAGLTQAELARRTGIHRPNIARVEAGRHTPSLETLARIASAIGVSTTHVLVSRES